MWLALTLGGLHVAEAGERHALLVAIADYSYDPNWASLASAADVDLLAAVLQRHDFAPDHVRVVRDAAATKAGILGELEAVAKRVRPGDHVWFHYSGHGQQVGDDNGDEADGYDESLVAYGAPMRAVPGYTGQDHLRDDELGRALERVRERLGPEGSLAVTLDSCHSGTATRGELKSRGGAAPIGPAPSSPASKVATEGSDFLSVKDQPTSRGAGADLAPLVVISASQASQPSKEVYGPDGAPVGALSLSLVQALTDERPVSTWSGVFDRVRGAMAEMALGQRPALEGTGDLALFDGEVLKAPPYASVTTVGAGGDLILAAGLLSGFSVGSRVALHAGGTVSPDEASRLAVGEVVSATPTTSTVRLDAGAVVADKDIRGGRLFITGQAAGGAALTVQLAVAGERDRAWREALSGFPLVAVVDGPADVRITSQGTNEVLQRADSDQALATGPASRDPGTSEVFGEVKQLAFGALARSIDLDGAAYELKVEVLPAIPSADGLSCQVQGDAPVDGPVVVGDGDSFKLRVTPLGAVAPYVTMLHVDSAGRATQLVPQRGQGVPQPAAQKPWVVDYCFNVAGEDREVAEQIKLFATRVPVDLGPVLGYVDVGTRGGASDLQKLLEEASTGTRGLRPAAVVADGWSTELTVTVLQKP